MENCICLLLGEAMIGSLIYRFNMNNLNHKEIQQMSLDVLQDVHDFCVKNDIKYSLAYGTLIGAIRHKGFIPWDDDIDIIMPRPDYERFFATFNCKGRGKIYEKDEDCYINYGRVFDTEKTICESIIPLSGNYKGGVWIDIFPIDGVSDDRESFSKEIRTMNRTWMMQLRYRYSRASMADIFRTASLKDTCILMAIKCSFQGKRLLEDTNNILRQYALKYPYGSTGHWSQLVCLDDKDRNYQLIEDFSETVDVPFEGRSFKMMIGYDRVLRNIYGDYMQLPPRDQQVPKHGHVTFFWK